MAPADQKAIAIDLIGIAPSYQGGASVFANTLLNEFLANPENKFHLILPISQKLSYLNLKPEANRITINFFEPRNNFVVKIMFGLATRIFKNSHLLSLIQKYRWKKAIDFIESNSIACLSLTTYISFPLKKIRHYCTLHDIQEKAFPQYFSRRERAIRHTNVKNTLRNVTGIQVSSYFVQNEIIRYYAKFVKQIHFHIIPEGYSSSELVAKKNLPKRRLPIKILMPANYWPHKDHLTLFESVTQLNAMYDIEVFCTGSTFDKIEKIEKELNKRNLHNVHFTGYVSREKLIQLYNSCHIVLSCSMYESSSLPILEGSVLGCLPIASDIPSHLEMKNRLHIKLFKQGSSIDLARAISEVISDLSEGNAQTRLLNAENLKKLSWQYLIPLYLNFLSNSREGEPQK
jgi:glycosyltransferase involved in cell wall biosynthesis